MDNPYLPEAVRIAAVFRETPDVKTISLNHPLKFSPGQFLQITHFGTGEAPISISSTPAEKDLRITFKRAGSVTGALFSLKKNDVIGIRGPLGRGFPLDDLKGKKLILVAGGVGMAPLRSLLKFILSEGSGPFGDVVLLYGSRTPLDMLYKKELPGWGKRIKVICTVDRASAGWKGRVGVVPDLLNDLEFDPRGTKAVVCGPPIMMRFTTARLMKMGMRPADIVLSLERYMKCGIGKCGHCYIADKFVCQDGPVFTCEELDKLVPAEAL